MEETKTYQRVKSININMGQTYHSRSLYMMVKKTCRNRLTAFINTANRKSQASPDIMVDRNQGRGDLELLDYIVGDDRKRVGVRRWEAAAASARSEIVVGRRAVAEGELRRVGGEEAGKARKGDEGQEGREGGDIVGEWWWWDRGEM
jgi:hypothetical protein